MHRLLFASSHWLETSGSLHADRQQAQRWSQGLLWLWLCQFQEPGDFTMGQWHYKVSFTRGTILHHWLHFDVTSHLLASLFGTIVGTNDKWHAQQLWPKCLIFETDVNQSRLGSPKYEIILDMEGSEFLGRSFPWKRLGSARAQPDVRVQHRERGGCRWWNGCSRVGVFVGLFWCWFVC